MIDGPSAAGGGRMCVLVVDDSLTALRLVQAVFESEHYEVVTASDGMEGLEKVQQRLPDLIVTDSVMPGVDGFAFLRKLVRRFALNVRALVRLRVSPLRVS